MNTLLQEGLLRTKNFSHAAIIKRKGGAIKAKSHAFQLLPDELRRLEACFARPEEARGSAEPVITVMHASYRAVRCDTMSFYGRNDKNGLVVARTASYYILGTYNDTMHPSIATEAVERLGEYFVEWVPA